MFQCAFCISEIEQDSFFCDQCGKEILLCETCLTPGKDKWCQEDGGVLIAAKSKSGNRIVNDNFTTEQNFSQNTKQTSTQTTQTHSPTPIPILSLINYNLGIQFEITDGEVLGRNTGPNANKLSNLPAVSGKHLIFNYDKQIGWNFQDIGSTNGTKHSKTNTMWNNLTKINPHIPIKIEDNEYILIANIEFLIKIENNFPGNNTQRI